MSYLNLLALPTLDATSIVFYLGALYGLVRALQELLTWVRNWKKGVREDAQHTAHSAKELIGFQDKTIDRLKDEYASLAERERLAIARAEEAEAANLVIEAKLTKAAREWFERQGFINELERRLQAIEREKDTHRGG